MYVVDGRMRRMCIGCSDGELQMLRRLRVLVGRVFSLDDCGGHDVYHCRLLLLDRRDFPLAMNGLWFGRQYRSLRLLVRYLLLCVQDANARLFAAVLLSPTYIRYLSRP